MKTGVLAGAVCACMGAGTWADTAALVASGDNTLFQDPAGSVSNGAGNSLFAGSTQQGLARRGLVAFDLSSIPAGSTITGASLSLFMAQTNGGTIRVGLHRVTNGWGEGASNGSGQGAPATAGDATWLHRAFDTLLWDSPGGDFVAGASASAPVGGVGVYTWGGAGLAADVQAWLDGGAGNFGWLLMGEEQVVGAAKRFASREAVVASQRPVLTLEYVVPAPGSLALVGLAGVCAARRRRR